MKCILSLTYLLALAWARPDDVDDPSLLAGGGRGGESIGSHPFAKYKVIALDIDAVSTTTTSTIPAAETTPLECFQVAEPVPSPPGSAFPENDSASRALIRNGAAITASEPGCEVVLMEHTFANSYGAPFVGNYTPPECDFDHVVMNFTVLVKGRQYDRTGVMYLGDTEVWRTSTAEPNPNGIRWVYQKDMTSFLSLWKQPQTIIFDLENNVDDTYTGLLNTTLTATFFKLSSQQVVQPPADLIIPISQRLGSTGKPSQFTVPEQDATSTVSFPQNVNRAVFTVDVKGQGNEEFWWSNVPQSATHTFEGDYGTYPGYSPWREVQVLIDGQLAGVSWPYPVIYTGGVVPHLHRPIVGIQAFDIREQEIDVTPWLPLLCDGSDHAFTIKIVGLEDDGAASAALSTTTESSWYVTGKVFLWLDDEDSVTTGTLGDVSASDPPSIAFSQRITQNATGGNETLEYDITVSRDLSIRSVVQTQHSQGTASWTQSLRYSNTGGVYAYGYDNLNTFTITGSAEAAGPGSDPPSQSGLDASSYHYSTNYSYPLFCNSTATYAPEGNLTLWAALDQGLDLEVRGGAVFPTGLAAFATAVSLDDQGFQGSSLSTWRNSTADYYRPADNSYSKGVGKTHQVFSFGGLTGDDAAAPTELYFRDVSAYNDTVTDDHVELAGKTV